MKRVTVKEIRTWMKTLEENRYKRLVIADARRVAWFVNNQLSDNYDTMPKTLRKKWSEAKYGKERYLAEKYLRKLTESVLKRRIKNILKEVIREAKNTKRSPGLNSTGS